MVSGVAGLMLSTNKGKDLKWFEIRAILQGTAKKVDDQCADATGVWKHWNGSTWITQPPSAGTIGLDYHSQWYGFGRLDADAAVAWADKGVVPAGAASNLSCNMV
jgi:hypothetical protein